MWVWGGKGRRLIGLADERKKRIKNTKNHKKKGREERRDSVCRACNCLLNGKRSRETKWLLRKKKNLHSVSK